MAQALSFLLPESTYTEEREYKIELEYRPKQSHKMPEKQLDFKISNQLT